MRAEDRELLGEVIGFYHHTLRESPEAQALLERRRIAHPEAVERFRLGFANRTLGYRLPDKDRGAGADIRGRLQRLGILRSSGHEHFAGSLVVPVVNDGIVHEVYGRKVGERLRAGTPPHLYLPGPHARVFNVEAFAASDEIIVAESLIDALSLWCGVPPRHRRLRHRGRDGRPARRHPHQRRAPGAHRLRCRRRPATPLPPSSPGS